MAIREAFVDDIPALMAMSGRFHAASPWRDIPVDPERLEESLFGFITGEHSAVFVTEALDGGIGMIAAPIYFSHAWAAQEVFWWCESPRDALGLLAAAEGWAAEHGAEVMSMIRLDGLNDEQMHRLYTRRGYAPTEHTYMRSL